jgi:hypothetical protein
MRHGGSRKRRGLSYRKRVADINRIYEEHVKDGLSNREIWLRFVYPRYAVSERTFYNLLTSSMDADKALPDDTPGLFDFSDN